ncbi:hypothetical protein Nepgr_006354 [Nepenthes gracilis]|uniref:Uncharacterized protein n=1 Tax=Nepenthes gracilis TaxID=150966 RepID=A0AAD3XH98_NEPGR|nr:hypothetical protein Nepgr_006354 [Nepenthes gracilis]
MEFMTISNTYVTIKERIEGAPKESNFEFKTEPLHLSAEPCLNRVIVKCYLVSIDPYILNCMKINCPPSLSDVVSVTPGQPIAAYGVGRVVASGFPEIERDELVVGFLSWGEYCVVEDGSKLRKLDPMGFPLSYHLGVLGLSGLTAYSGFFEVCKPRKGEKVFVSAASGSVGHLVGQFAKLFGCYVVGCAGTKHKVELLKEKLGFDDAFNYKEEFDLKSALRRCFPDGIDIYFDNVGGELLEAAVTNMNSNGRVAACGAIAEYINNRRRAALNLLDVISKRIAIQGFLTLDRIDMFSDFISTMSVINLDPPGGLVCPANRWQLASRRKKEVLCYLDMLNCGVEANKYTYPPLIKACSMLGRCSLRGSCLTECLRKTWCCGPP